MRRRNKSNHANHKQEPGRPMPTTRIHADSADHAEEGGADHEEEPG